MKVVNTSSDSGKYLLAGLRWYRGEGQEFLLRGPGVPLLISMFFQLFGVSVKSGFLLVRVFFVLNVWVVYAMGSKLFGRWTGFAPRAGGME